MNQTCPLCVIRILFQVPLHGWISGRKIYSVKLPLGRVQPLEWKVVGAQAFRVSNGSFLISPWEGLKQRDGRQKEEWRKAVGWGEGL